ncbi:septum site-determining protein MinC [Halomonas sp. PA16-9]|uniref:septum site-determining protein MinC n=1 Tax=Halomonas sp. PA16-9 TaxID=2576841 RepID=UPI0030EF9C9F
MSLNVDSAVVAFTFKGGMLPMTVMELSSADPEQIRQQLAGKFSQSPAFFQHTPVVLSVEKLDEPHLALERICAVCRDHKLLPVAVRGGTEPVRQSSWALGLGWFPPVAEGRARGLESVSNSPVQEVSREEAVSEAEAPTLATRLYRGTVRSGQQVSASDGDLVVIGAVNAGAEVLAAGSIHVYGALRGRALAVFMAISKRVFTAANWRLNCFQWQVITNALKILMRSFWGGPQKFTLQKNSLKLSHWAKVFV